MFTPRQRARFAVLPLVSACALTQFQPAPAAQAPSPVSAALPDPPVAPAQRRRRLPPAAECSTPRPEWIWCDDFETDRLASYFEYANREGRFVRAAGVGVDGSVGMSATYPTGPESAPGALHLAFGRVPDPYFRPVDAGTMDYREIYWRVYVMHPLTWVGGSPDKMTRAIGFATNTWAESMVAHVWNGGGSDTRLYIDPASGTDEAGLLKTTVYNDFANFRWLGAAGSATDIFDAAHLGNWVCVEAHVRLNDALQSNGLFELWIDNQLEASRTALNWSGIYSAYGINSIFFENFWNAGSPVEQTRYWDNIVVSTQPIGC